MGGHTQTIISTDVCDKQIFVPAITSATTNDEQPPAQTISSADVSDKETQLQLLEEESLSELVDVLPDPENVFSDAI